MFDSSEPGVAALNVVNNGLITATNIADNSGIVGFNGGRGVTITVTGSGRRRKSLASSDPSLPTAESISNDRLERSIPASINMRAGNVLFAPEEQDLMVYTNMGDVLIAQGALAFIMQSQHDVAIYDVADRHADDITVVAAKRQITLKPEKQIVLTKQTTTDFNAVNPGCNCLGFRRISHQPVYEDVYMFSADYSMFSAIKNVKPLHDIMNSSDPQNLKSAGLVLKSLVIVNKMTDHLGLYKIKQSDIK